MQVKKSEFQRKKKSMIENEMEYDKQEKAEVKVEDVKTHKPEDPAIGLSYGQSLGLKDDLDVDDDIGKCIGI